VRNGISPSSRFLPLIVNSKDFFAPLMGGRVRGARAGAGAGAGGAGGALPKGLRGGREDGGGAIALAGRGDCPKLLRGTDLGSTALRAAALISLGDIPKEEFINLLLTQI
jgi:hypothetical protein